MKDKKKSNESYMEIKLPATLVQDICIKYLEEKGYYNVFVDVTEDDGSIVLGVNRCYDEKE